MSARPPQSLLRQVARHQAEPVAIERGLVLGVHSPNRILAIYDRGDRRFPTYVGDIGDIGLADRRGRVMTISIWIGLFFSRKCLGVSASPR